MNLYLPYCSFNSVLKSCSNWYDLNEFINHLFSLFVLKSCSNWYDLNVKAGEKILTQFLRVVVIGMIWTNFWHRLAFQPVLKSCSNWYDLNYLLQVYNQHHVLKSCSNWYDLNLIVLIFRIKRFLRVVVIGMIWTKRANKINLNRFLRVVVIGMIWTFWH